MVLGINNRTENYKTASCFSSFMNEKEILKKLATRLGEDEATPIENICIELFWKGVRDWLHQEESEFRASRVKLLVQGSEKILLGVREKICAFSREDGNSFRRLKDSAYTMENTEKLANNLRNTEIDVVLESPTKFYIGEAKLSESFSGDSDLVLVHQLIRQYIVAKVLVDVIDLKKEIVPFVIVPEARLNRWWQSMEDNVRSPSGNCPAQVRFMIDKMGMGSKNCLAWEEIDQMKLH